MSLIPLWITTLSGVGVPEKVDVVAEDDKTVEAVVENVVAGSTVGVVEENEA